MILVFCFGIFRDLYLSLSSLSLPPFASVFPPISRFFILLPRSPSFAWVGWSLVPSEGESQIAPHYTRQAFSLGLAAGVMTIVSIFDLWLPVMLEEVINVRTLPEMFAFDLLLTTPLLLQTATAGTLALDSGYSCRVSCFPGGVGWGWAGRGTLLLKW